MRYRFVILFLLICSLPAGAQSRDTILTRMNAVKLYPDCIYGYCALSSAEDSRAEALADLACRVEAFLKEKGFQHLRDLSQCPDGMVQTLVYTKGPDYFRTLVYVDKVALSQLESDLSRKNEAQGQYRAVSSLKERLAGVTTYGELEALLADKEVATSVLRGPLTFDTPQDYVDRGYLVYYDHKTSRILRVMTPRNDDGIRFDVKTGAPGHPRTASQGEIEWICFKGPVNK